MSLSDPEQTQWTLSLDGTDFAASGWVPIEAHRAGGGEAPHQAVVENGAPVVRYRYFYAHTLGWRSGPVTLTFDLPTMTVQVHEELEFEPDGRDWCRSARALESRALRWDHRHL